MMAPCPLTPLSCSQWPGSDTFVFNPHRSSGKEQPYILDKKTEAQRKMA